MKKILFLVFLIIFTKIVLADDDKIVVAEKPEKDSAGGIYIVEKNKVFYCKLNKDMGGDILCFSY